MAKKRKKNRGVVLVTVLFVIMAITVIALGLFARTDMHLACARNFTLRMQIDALAYSGLECARVLVVDPNFASPWSGPVTLPDLDSSLHCDLEIGLPVETAAADPNDPSTYLYPVTSRAYRQVGAETLADCVLSGSLFYDPNEPVRAVYHSINRVR